MSFVTGKIVKNVLIISPHFPPVNAPDHQRLRMALPHLEENGWNPTVLAVDPENIAAPSDETLLKILPSRFKPVYSQALPLAFSVIPGLGTLSWRAYSSLKKKGDELIRKTPFDLIFFTTTQFGVFSLGHYWKKKWGIPFALDLQDPWINDFYQKNHLRPPGGYLKYTIQQKLAQRQAEITIPAASGICAVSENYTAHFQASGWIQPNCKLLTLPFPYSKQDWQMAQTHTASLPWQQINKASHWVYTGRGGSDLHPCLMALFQSLVRYLKHNKHQQPPLHLWFIGTQYGSADTTQKPIKALAEQAGYPHVHEIAGRLPYLDTLHMMQQSDGLVVPGSIDARYNPSKLIPLLASGKPLLVLAPDSSPCFQTMQDLAPDHVLSYPLPFAPNVLADKLFHYWDQHSLKLPAMDQSHPKLAQREAAVSTKQLSDFFNHCIAHA